MRIAADETGNRYGKWTVIKRAGNKNRSALWLCRCDCGTERILKGSKLRDGSTRSCGCSRRLSPEVIEARKKSNTKEARLPHQQKEKLSPHDATRNYLFQQCRSRARRKGFVFTLSLSEFELLITSNCYYCGSVPDHIFYSRRGNNGTHKYNGVDRIDSNVGYEPDNCVSCCTICNMAKGVMPVVDFLDWVERVHQHGVGKQYPRIPEESGKD